MTRVIVGVLAAAGTVVLVWTAWQLADRDARWETTTFDVVSEDSVSVSFNVSGEPGATLRCAVRAGGPDGADAGYLLTDVGPLPGNGRLAETVTVRTLERASRAVVVTCVPLPEPLA